MKTSVPEEGSSQPTGAVQRYEVIYEHQRLALSFVSPHPDYAGHIIVSVIPVNRKGKWENDTLTITFENALFDFFLASMPEIDAVKEVLAQAGIEPHKVEVRPVSAW